MAFTHILACKQNDNMKYREWGMFARHSFIKCVFMIVGHQNDKVSFSLNAAMSSNSCAKKMIFNN